MKTCKSQNLIILSIEMCNHENIRVKKILVQLSRTQFLRGLKFAPFSPILLLEKPCKVSMKKSLRSSTFKSHEMKLCKVKRRKEWTNHKMSKKIPTQQLLTFNESLEQNCVSKDKTIQKKKKEGCQISVHNDGKNSFFPGNIFQKC